VTWIEEDEKLLQKLSASGSGSLDDVNEVIKEIERERKKRKARS
jgi:hypothetical protein